MAHETQNPTTTTSREMSLAFERHGAGVPIVLLPGLTFERRTWRPIVERLGGDVCSLAVDLPAQVTAPACPATSRMWRPWSTSSS
jgi:hypothetical protein